MIGGNTWKANWILLRLFWDMQALIGHVLLQAQVPESTCQRQGNVHIEAFASVLASCLQLHQFIGSSYLNLSWGSGLPSCRCICRHLSALCWLGFWPWYGSTKLRFQHRVARHVESFDYVKISYSLNFLLIQKEMNIKKLPINEKIKIKKFAHQWEYQKSTNIYIYISLFLLLMGKILHHLDMFAKTLWWMGYKGIFTVGLAQRIGRSTVSN